MPRARALRPLVAVGAAAATFSLVLAQHGGSAVAIPQMPGGAEPTPVATWRLSLNGGPSTHVTECTGFGSRSDVIEYRSGADGQTVQRVPGQLRWTDITCSAPLSADRTLYDWRQRLLTGGADAARADAVFEQLSSTNEVVRRWQVRQAWPVQYLEAFDRAVIVLAHERAALA